MNPLNLEDGGPGEVVHSGTEKAKSGTGGKKASTGTVRTCSHQHRNTSISPEKQRTVVDRERVGMGGKEAGERETSQWVPLSSLYRTDP